MKYSSKKDKEHRERNEELKREHAAQLAREYRMGRDLLIRLGVHVAPPIDDDAARYVRSMGLE